MAMAAPAQVASAATASVPGTAIFSTPNVLRLSADAQTVAVRVTYRCTDTNKTWHYIVGSISQYDSDAYTWGYRNGPGALVRAACTGKVVTKTYLYTRSNNTPQPALYGGKANFRFSIEARGGPGTPGGWYVTTGTALSVVRTVDVKAPSRQLAIRNIRYDAPGDDARNLNGEYLTLWNPSAVNIQIKGYQLDTGYEGPRFTFSASRVLKPGESVILRSGEGVQAKDLYLWSRVELWNNLGDSATLSNPAGDVTSRYSY